MTLVFVSMKDSIGRNSLNKNINKYFFFYLIFIAHFLESSPSMFVKTSELLEYSLSTNTEDTINIPANKCVEISLNTLYQNTLIEIKPNEISKLIISDKKLSLTSTNILNCEINSHFCYEYIYSESISFTSNLCASKILIYACSSLTNNIIPVNSEDENNNSVEVSKTSNVNIKNKISSSPCKYTNLNEEIFCSFQNIDSCSDNSKCYNICEKLNCVSESENISLCINKKSVSKKREICENLLKSNVISSNSIECTSNIQFPNDKKNKEVNIYKTFAIIIGVVIVIILLLSLYYRVKIKENGTPPFNPPNFMPGFLFPREN